MKTITITRTRLLSLVGKLVLPVFVLASAPAGLWVSNGLVPRSGALGFLAQASAGDDHVAGEVLCALKAATTDPKIVADRHNMKVLEDLEEGNYRLGTPPATGLEQAVAELSADPDVASAEPNRFLRVVEVDQQSVAWVDQQSVAWVDGQPPANYVGQDAVRIIRAAEAHAYANGGGVTVAVVDTGLDASHPAFRQAVKGRDFVDNDNDPAEVPGGVAYGHGTMIAGIIAVMAPNSRIVAVRAFNAQGIGKASDVANAIRYAAKSGANVIDMSFGLLSPSSTVRAAIAYAWRKGTIMVVSGGNNNTSLPQYPAADDRVIAVSAADSADVKADFSNYGDHIDLSAPGVSVYSTYPGGRFAWWNGTSFAAAFVSGEAALVLSTGRDPSSVMARTAVNIDALNPGYRGLLGSGRIDALAAVTR